MQNPIRSYDRERKPYIADWKIIEAYATWLKLFPWQLFATLTFSRKVSDPQAVEIFDKFIATIQRDRRCIVGYVRGDERRFSGCGKPACGRHFHALLTCTASLDPKYVGLLWMDMAGHRSDHAGAQVEPYDPKQNGISYALKFMNQPDGDWAHKNLHLFHPSPGIEITMRMRRNFRRHQQFARVVPPAPVHAEPTDATC